MNPAVRIKQRAKEKGWTLHRLATECGYKSHSSITDLLKRIENDESAVELRTIEKIAKTLGVTSKYILLGEDSGQTDVDPPSTAELVHENIRMGDLANWRQLVSAAKDIYPAKPWVWLRVENSMQMLIAEPTVSSVVQHAKIVAEHETPPPDGVDPIEYWNRISNERRKRALEKLK